MSAQSPHLREAKRRPLSGLWGPACLLGVWVGVAKLEQYVPSPARTAQAAWELATAGLFYEATWQSLKRVAAGFSLGSLIGIALGLTTGLVPSIRTAMGGAVDLLRPIPPIAWIPLAVVVFGIGNSSAVFVIFLGAFFPVFTNTFLGVASVQRSHVEVAKLLGAPPATIVRRVIWPSALPKVFAGLTIGLGVAWMCVVAAEMVAARSGLGYQIQVDRQLLRMDRVVAAMATIGILGFLLARLLAFAERIFVPWVHGRRRSPSRIAGLGRDIARRLATGLLGNPNRTATILDSQALEGPSTPVGLNAKGVGFCYEPENPVLRDVSLRVEPGAFVSVVGPSGCGKTTLLRVVAGLEEPATGSLEFVDAASARVQGVSLAMVFQDLALFDWLTAIGNVSFPIEMRDRSRHHAKLTAAILLDTMGIRDRANAFPGELSGGQAQRVALARSLAARPKVLLMDEPFSGLDGPTRERLQEETRTLLAQRSVSVVMVTHDIREAVFLSDQVVVMRRDGAVKTAVAIPRTAERNADFRHSKLFLETEDNIREAIQ